MSVTRQFARAEIEARHRARLRGEDVLRAAHDTRKRDWRERFFEKVEFRGTEECWPWKGAVNKVTGYGVFGRGPGKLVVAAHVVAMEFFADEAVPKGMTVDHVRARGCVRRDCVNPAHLEVVPPGVNSLRALDSPPSINARKTACPRGHSYSVHGYTRPNGWRYCRTCANEQQREKAGVSGGKHIEAA